ncbi:peptidase M20 [Lichenicoccus sp.]|uniref:peptidase M20 n=1 Tax=Lichenicoccus sp. TaxID=2781899 RepID=UPI003D143BF7
MPDDLLTRIDAALDAQELQALVLELSNIPSSQGREEQAGHYVFDWMAREGFGPRKVAAVPHRFSVVGSYGGFGRRGSARDLLFSSHLDTEGPMGDRHDAWRERPDTPPPELNRIEDGTFIGAAIANDRGPMSCFLMAAKALRTAGIRLAGQMILTACPGEIGPDPVEELEGVANSGKDVGALYMLHHGGVAPDYMIAAEGTDFGVTSVGSGYAIFRIRLFGEEAYTPILDSPADPRAHPNPIYHLGAAIAALNHWGRQYEHAHRYESAGGIAVPKVQIGAVRAGVPHAIGGGTAVCALYVEVGLTPASRLQAVRREIGETLEQAGFSDFDLQPMTVRNAFAADEAQVRPLRQALGNALQTVRGETLRIASPVYSSMWRDHNVFNMNRVPAVTMGPPRHRPTLHDLVDCARLYAMTAIEICGVAAPQENS